MREGLSREAAAAKSHPILRGAQAECRKGMEEEAGSKGVSNYLSKNQEVKLREKRI